MRNARPRVKTKIIRPEIKGVDADKFTVDAVLSTESKDRDGDILKSDGWNLTNFLSHSVFLSSHDNRSLLKILGEWTDVKVVGKQLRGTANYLVGEGNPEVDWAFRLAQRGMAAFSVGFIPDWEKAEVMDDGDPFWGPFVFTNMELLEVSQVTVPANQDALQRMKGFGLHPDIEGIVEELLTDTMPATGDNPDAQEVIRQLAESIAAPIKAAMKQQDARIDEVLGAIAELKAAPAPDPDPTPDPAPDPVPAFDAAAVITNAINSHEVMGVPTR